MNKAEIIAELPKLQPQEREHIFRCLCELQEQDILNGGGPTEEEKRILDAALIEIEQTGDEGIPWREVIRQIRSSAAQ